MRKLVTAGMALMIGALALAACGTSAPTPTTLAPNHVGHRSAIPWSHVGPRWSLALWSSQAAKIYDTPNNSTSPLSYSLFLVAPNGGRYFITSVPSNTSLLDWSPTTHRALLDEPPFCPAGAHCPADVSQAVLVTMSLSSGRTLTTSEIGFSQTVLYSSADFTRPRGRALLVETQTNDHQRLTRTSLTGVVQQTYPYLFSEVGKYTGYTVSSSDGTHLILGAAGGVVDVSNAGAVLHQYSIPGVVYCEPTRWWMSDVILTSCSGAASPPQLYLVNTLTATVTTLSQSPTGMDNGDENAWQLRDGIYVQTAGGCGYQYLSRLNASGHTTPVTVPRVATGDSVWVLAATHASLLLHATLGCGPGQSLVWFTPSSHRTTVVLGPPLNGGSVVDALGFPEK